MVQGYASYISTRFVLIWVPFLKRDPNQASKGDRMQGYAFCFVTCASEVTGRKANEKQFALSNVNLIPIENLAYGTLGWINSFPPNTAGGLVILLLHVDQGRGRIANTADGLVMLLFRAGHWRWLSPNTGGSFMFMLLPHAGEAQGHCWPWNTSGWLVYVLFLRWLRASDADAENKHSRKILSAAVKATAE